MSLNCIGYKRLTISLMLVHCTFHFVFLGFIKTDPSNLKLIPSSSPIIFHPELLNRSTCRQSRPDTRTGLLCVVFLVFGFGSEFKEDSENGRGAESGRPFPGNGGQPRPPRSPGPSADCSPGELQSHFGHCDIVD